MGAPPNQSDATSPVSSERERLGSWKEIAAYLSRDVRTVQRWEKREGMPVYRDQEGRLGSVFAYRDEIDDWWKKRFALSGAEKPTTGAGRFGFVDSFRRHRWQWLISAAVLLAFASAMAYRRGPRASGSAGPPRAAGANLSMHRIWAGPELASPIALSPDAKMLALVDTSTGNLALRDLTTGQRRLMTYKNSPREHVEASVWSPDGKQIAYVWSVGDVRYELWVTPLDGSPARMVYRLVEQGYLLPIEWSPDGENVLTVVSRPDASEQLMLISTSSGTTHVLKTISGHFAGKMSFSPDGRYIAYGRRPAENSPARHLFLLSVDSGTDAPLVEHTSRDFVLGWAPDGSHFFFLSDRSGSPCIWALPMRDAHASGAPELYRQDIGRIWPLLIASDGDFYYNLITDLDDVFLVDFDSGTRTLTGAPRRVQQRSSGLNNSPDWAPDGRQLAYLFYRGTLLGGAGPPLLWMRRLDSGEGREMAPRMLQFEQIRWSPDGRSFLAVGRAPGDRPGLYRIDSQSGAATQLVHADSAWLSVREPLWLPGGRSILYIRGNRGRNYSAIYRRDLQSGTEKELFRTTVPSGPWYVSLSPDGRRLAFVTTEVAVGTVTLKVLSLEDGQLGVALTVKKPESIQAVAWVPDGRELLFVRREVGPAGKQDSLWRIATHGGEPVKLGLEMNGMRELRVRYDGRMIAFTAGVPSAELWVMENLSAGGR